jgi:hypothetical protein
MQNITVIANINPSVYGIDINACINASPESLFIWREIINVIQAIPIKTKNIKNIFLFINYYFKG